MGNPIRHSLSPRIHTLFAEQTGERIEYLAILVEPGGFRQAVDQFVAEGGKGINVTVPFKREAYELADGCSERARRAGAANTLIIEGGGLIKADNTDGVGLVRDLRENLGWELEGRELLLLGAGGAARGVLGPLLEALPKRLVVANRTPDTAELLAEEFADLGPVSGCGLPDLAGERFDLVIHATSAGLQGQVPELPEDLDLRGTACYDLQYGPQPTPFLRWARGRGAGPLVDGLGMLVEQAAESFWLWRQVRPRTRPVLETLRAELAGQG
ncbi:MAG: shikimate dehydrogenase [Gammaproteobacteria bacterium]|nr:MAG: shikimate dehydrogenase [Gammaproteobacteria bacterium]